MRLDCEKVSVLITGYVDDELTQQESQSVSIHLEHCADCQKTMQQLKRAKRTMVHIADNKITESEIEHIINEPRAKLLRWSGALVMSVCVAILVGFSAYSFWFNDATAFWLKIVMSAFYGGFVLLFLSVLIQRIKRYKNDRYKGVDL